MTGDVCEVPDDVLEQRRAVVGWLRDVLGCPVVLAPVHGGTPGWVVRLA